MFKFMFKFKYTLARWGSAMAIGAIQMVQAGRGALISGSRGTSAKRLCRNKTR